MRREQAGSAGRADLMEGIGKENDVAGLRAAAFRYPLVGAISIFGPMSVSK
jgi:hypothetical protein